MFQSILYLISLVPNSLNQIESLKNIQFNIDSPKSAIIRSPTKELQKHQLLQIDDAVKFLKKDLSH